MYTSSMYHFGLFSRSFCRSLKLSVQLLYHSTRKEGCTSFKLQPSFFKQYLNIIEHPDNYSEDDIYDFLYDYLYPNAGSDSDHNYENSQPYHYDHTPYDGDDSDGYDYYYEYPTPHQEESGHHNVI